MAVTTNRKARHNYTLADIASRMGISSTAVSMALRNSGGVSDKLREKVLKVAAEMDYSPALAARMLRAKNTGQLGLYIPVEKVEQVEVSGGFMMPVMVHFVNQCEENKYSYHIEFGKRFDEFVPPSQLTGRIVDGVLLIGAQRPELTEWLSLHQEYKWVSVIEQSEYCVLSNNRAGIYHAVEYLAAMGHREIGFAHCDVSYAAHSTALAGYWDAVKDFSLGPAEHYVHEFDSRSGGMDLQRVDRWCDFILSQPKRPTALICNDQKIVSVLMVNAARKGIRIPHDLSVISYGVKDMSERMYPKTTSVEPDFPVIIEKSLGMLIKRVQNEPLPEKQVLVETRLVKRDTVAAPAKV